MSGVERTKIDENSPRNNWTIELQTSTSQSMAPSASKQYIVIHVLLATCNKLDFFFPPASLAWYLKHAPNVKKYLEYDTNLVLQPPTPCAVFCVVSPQIFSYH